MSPDSRAAQSTVLLAALSTGSAAPAGGIRHQEALGDAISEVEKVVCERA